LVLSEKALTYPMHYVRSRTTPCLSPGPCEGCDANLEVRYKAYLAIYFPRDAVIAIFETTDHGGQVLVDHYKKNGSIRGKKLTVWRTGKKDNGPCNCLLSQLPDVMSALPEAPDVREFLNRMWYSRRPRPAEGPHESAPALSGQQSFVDRHRGRDSAGPPGRPKMQPQIPR